MLYVGCSFCRNIGPLLCAGSFPPHPLMSAFQGPMGALCPFCGPMLPWFACGRCGSRQMMFFPTASSFFPPQVSPGVMPSLAPVVQAAPGMSGNQLNSLFSKTITEFCTGFAGQFGQDMASALSGWIQGGIQGGWQS